MSTNTTERWDKPAQPWACPAGTHLASADIDRETWLELRRSMICASDIAAILGVTKWGDGLTVWADKTGRAAPDPTTAAQDRGLIFEEPIVQLWAKHYAEHPIEWRRTGLMRSRRDPIFGASIDRISICPLGKCLIEVKSQADVSKWDGDEVPVEYQLQGQHQLAVSGRDHVHFVVLGPRFVPIERVMFRDDELISTLWTDLAEWWQLHVLDDLRPTATSVALETAKRLALPEAGTKLIISDELAPHVRAAKAAKVSISEAEDQLASALAEIYAAMGSHTMLVWDDDAPCLTWNPGKKVAGADKAWRKAHPDLVAAYSVPGPDVLDLPKMVENHPELIDSRELYYTRTTSWK